MKEEALALADYLDNNVEAMLFTEQPHLDRASAMIRRLVEELDKIEKDLALKTRDRDVFCDFTLAYEKRIEELESQLKDDEPMKICNLVNETYQVIKNDEVFHQGSLESCESFIRVFEKEHGIK
jgi:uncharacterized coiled-coil protein SlyX